MSDNGACREMTLHEYMGMLYEGHSAHKEFAQLESDLKAKSGEVERLKGVVNDCNDRIIRQSEFLTRAETAERDARTSKAMAETAVQAALTAEAKRDEWFDTYTATMEDQCRIGEQLTAAESREDSAVRALDRERGVR